jgi:large subunit ribosomal protein L5e
MKGAVDGGIHIPHKDKIFPKVKEETGKGKKKDDKAVSGNPLRDRIFGLHVQKYMDLLSKDKKAYSKQFSLWDKCLKDSGSKNVEELYKKIFTEVRKNPEKADGKKKSEQKKITRDPKDVNICTNGKHKYRRDKRISNQQRKDNVNKKIQKFIADRKKAAATKKK